MFFCQALSLAMKAKRIARYRKRYEEAKLAALCTQKRLDPYIPIWRRVINKIFRFLFDLLTLGFYRRVPFKEAKSHIYNKLFNSEVVRFIYFSIGIAFAWTLFAISYNIGREAPYSLTIKSVITVGVISFVMAFSLYLRTIVCLTIPIVLSSKGRYVILVHVITLMTSGPLLNIRTNLSENWRSIKCTADSVVDSLTQSFLNSPFIKFFRDMANTLNEMVASFNEIVTKVLNSLKSLFDAIIGVFKQLAKLLNDAVDYLTGSLKNWTTKCNNSLDSWYDSCVSSLGWWLDWLCYTLKAIKAVGCGGVKLVKNIVVNVAEAFRSIFGPLFDEIIETISNKWEATKKAILSFFTIRFHFKFNRTKAQGLDEGTYSKNFESVVKDLDNKFGLIFAIVSSFSFISYLLFALVFIRAWLYLKKFLLWDSFDNIYITPEIQRIDWERKLQGKPSVLPLGYIMGSNYSKPFSLKMTPAERRKLMIGLVTWLTFAAQVVFYMVLEHLIYGPVKFVRSYILTMNDEVPLPKIVIHTFPDTGAFASFAKDFAATSSGHRSYLSEIELKECAPDPWPPDYVMYKNVAFLLVLTLLSILLESYMLRLRHVIAGHLYPARRIARAGWLYNRLLATQPLLKLNARTNVRAKLRGDVTLTMGSKFKRLIYMNPILARIYDKITGTRKYCVVCSLSSLPEDWINFIKCSTPGCVAAYCRSCYAELDKSCPVCDVPKPHPGDEMIDEERDSSDEDDDEFQFAYEDDWASQDSTESEPEIDFSQNDKINAKNKFYTKYLNKPTSG